MTRTDPSGAASSRPLASACTGVVDRLDALEKSPAARSASSDAASERGTGGAGRHERVRDRRQRAQHRGHVLVGEDRADDASSAAAGRRSISQATPAGLWAPSQSSRSLRHSSRPGRRSSTGSARAGSSEQELDRLRAQLVLRGRPTTEPAPASRAPAAPTPLRRARPRRPARSRPASRPRSPRASSRATACARAPRW